MKLFVWTDFCRDYSPGLAFAIATEADKAMEMVRASLGHEPGDWGTLQVLPLDAPVAFAVYGGG